jgi:hypothetical protein
MVLDGAFLLTILQNMQFSSLFKLELPWIIIHYFVSSELTLPFCKQRMGLEPGTTKSINQASIYKRGIRYF